MKPGPQVRPRARIRVTDQVRDRAMYHATAATTHIRTPMSRHLSQPIMRSIQIATLHCLKKVDAQWLHHPQVPIDPPSPVQIVTTPRIQKVKVKVTVRVKVEVGVAVKVGAEVEVKATSQICQLRPRPLADLHIRHIILQTSPRQRVL